MSRPRSPFRAADLSRAIRQAVKAGLQPTRARIDETGAIDLYFGPEAKPEAEEPEPGDWRARLRESRGWAL